MRMLSANFCFSAVKDLEEGSSPAADSVETVPGSQLLWRITPRPPNSAQVWLLELSEECILTATRLMCVCVCVSHVFADVQLHQLRHAAERVAPGDGGDHPSDRLQAETGHTSHGQRGHWWGLVGISPHSGNITADWVSPTFFFFFFLVHTDLASQEKKRLEEKQRTARKSLSKSGEDWKTR